MPGDEILRDVLDRWKAGIDTQHSVGRQGVHDYYASQRPGMTVVYRILESRRLANDLVLGYA
ncbi:MAG: hypothetical protein WCB92_27725 [Mycobacterium sp.]